MAKKDKVSETPATALLRQQGVSFTEHPYEYLEHGGAQHVGGGVTDLLEGSHLRAGRHGGRPHSLGVPEAEGKDGASRPPLQAFFRS